MVRTWICIDKSTGRISGTWGPADSGPPPENDAHCFVDAAEHQGYSVLDTFVLATVPDVVDGAPVVKTVVTQRTPAPPAPDYGPSVDARAFILLFTLAQRIAFRAAAVTDVEVNDLLQLVSLPVPIRLRHPVILAGLQLLERNGIVDAAERERIADGISPEAQIDIRPPLSRGGGL